ncbi:MAG: YajQ family cyclic di-GMP-binding protein [bacterium]
MASESSFDIVSKPNPQELDNAVNQTLKEMATRFDFRGAPVKVELDLKAKELKLESDSEGRLKAIVDVLQGRLIKRGLSLRCIELQDAEPAGAGLWRQSAKLVDGIPMEKAKRIVASIKEKKFKVTASIQGESVRISSKSKDELQAVMSHAKGMDDLELDLQFTNFK